MGWGTFLAGQWARSLRSIKYRTYEKKPSGFEVWIKPWSQEYAVKVIKKTVLEHPSVKLKVDMDAWRTDLQAEGWLRGTFFVLTWAIVSGTTLGFEPELIWALPIYWFAMKYAMITHHASRINSKFEHKGYDTKELMSQLRLSRRIGRFQEKRDKRSKSKIENRDKDQARLDREKRKFGE